MKSLDELLQRTSGMHRHLCPRQILGVRMGLLAGKILRLALPQTDKRLLVIAETDGCAVDGISVATNCWVGRRTLRIEDYGKIAATFVDSHTRDAFRIVPRKTIRERAYEFAPPGSTKWIAHIIGYQRMPDEQLFHVQQVELVVPVEKILSRAGKKAICEECGEEIINEREIMLDGHTLCRACGMDSYYRTIVEISVPDS